MCGHPIVHNHVHECQAFCGQEYPFTPCTTQARHVHLCISYLQGSGEKGSSDVGRPAKTQVEDKLTGMDKSAAKAMKGDMQRSNLKNNNADDADDKVSSRLLLYVTASMVLISR